MTCVGGNEWYFYSHLDRKYTTGSRTNHATVSGYWKVTGKDMAIVKKGGLVWDGEDLGVLSRKGSQGEEDRLGHAPVQVGWLPSKNLHLLKVKYLLDEWELCRVFHKSRDVGPKPGIGGEPSVLSPPPLMDPNLGSDQQAPANMSKCPASPSLRSTQWIPCSQSLAYSNQGLHRMMLTHTEGSLIPVRHWTLSAEVLNDVLSHLTRMEISLRFKDSDNLGEGISNHFV